VKLPADRSEERDFGYELKPHALGELTPEEMKRCMAIIKDGGAVSRKTMKRDLPGSQVLAIARYRTEIVAVGAIKPVRKDYAAGIAVKSKYSFPADTPELGYVAVDAAHQGHGLSHQITHLLLSQHTGRLFATTESPRMKKTLANAGFCQEGKEWEGERGTLSFWERK
jgi:RimJ/RimL family protein N-acetyltransferase